MASKGSAKIGGAGCAPGRMRWGRKRFVRARGCRAPSSVSRSASSNAPVSMAHVSWLAGLQQTSRRGCRPPGSAHWRCRFGCLGKRCRRSWHRSRCCPGPARCCHCWARSRCRSPQPPQPAAWAAAGAAGRPGERAAAAAPAAPAGPEPQSPAEEGMLRGLQSEVTIAGG